MRALSSKFELPFHLPLFTRWVKAFLLCHLLHFGDFRQESGLSHLVTLDMHSMMEILNILFYNIVSPERMRALLARQSWASSAWTKSTSSELAWTQTTTMKISACPPRPFLISVPRMPSKRSMMSLNGSSERRCKASSGGSSKQRISQSIELVGERDESPNLSKRAEDRYYLAPHTMNSNYLNKGGSIAYTHSLIVVWAARKYYTLTRFIGLQSFI